MGKRPTSEEVDLLMIRCLPLSPHRAPPIHTAAAPHGEQPLLAEPFDVARSAGLNSVTRSVAPACGPKQRREIGSANVRALSAWRDRWH